MLFYAVATATIEGLTAKRDQKQNLGHRTLFFICLKGTSKRGLNNINVLVFYPLIGTVLVNQDVFKNNTKAKQDNELQQAFYFYSY